jgi:hypothetical protein
MYNYNAKFQQFVAIRNNKQMADKNNRHFFEVWKGSDHIGILLRLEAKTDRRNGNGTNDWDVWFFRETNVDERFQNLTVAHYLRRRQPPDTFRLGRLGGEDYILDVKRKTSTPFGEEFESLMIRIVPVDGLSIPVRECWRLYELMCLLPHSFGDYGEYLHRPEMLKYLVERIGPTKANEINDFISGNGKDPFPDIEPEVVLKPFIDDSILEFEGDQAYA